MKDNKGKVICVVVGLSVAATIGLLHETNNFNGMIKVISGNSGIVAKADPVSQDSNWSYIIVGADEISLTKYLGNETNLVIPSEVDDYTVVGIHFNYINGSDKIESIKIPDSVKMINLCCFEKFTNLKNIEIPESVITIYEGAFSECTSLKNVKLPNNIDVISDKTFLNCTALANIQMPNNLTKIGKYAFYGCSSLKSIEIPEKVTNIDIEAFTNCASLTSIKIPKDVTSIAEYALKNPSIEKVKIHNEDITIEDRAFEVDTNILIQCYKDSKAEVYAKQNGIKFEYLVASISVKKEQDAAIYTNREANYSGLVITCTDDRGKQFDVTEGFEVRPKIFKQDGSRKATVSYLGQEATYNVNVKKLLLESISVSTPPTKTIYKEGEGFFADGMVVKAKFNNGENKVIDTYEVIDDDKNQLTRWKENVTIRYYDADSEITKETTQKITVNPKEVSQISVVKNPLRTIYSKNESDLEVKGGIISVDFADGDNELVNFDAKGITFSSIKMGQIGSQTITVTFGEKSATYKVNVIDSNLEYNEIGGSIKITKIGQDSSKNRVEIPEKIGGKNVTSIDSNAIIDVESLNTIYIPSTVNSIPDDLLDNSENVTIECISGSYAEKYAKDHNIYYEYLDK